MVAKSVNESLRQAYQGSVSAIIQILNDRLSGTGVRTRAIFEGRILQLLCEAAQPEQLDQESLVQQVKSILEDISPRTIRRVNINARMIEEQQLLWLEEIKNDPQKLLWSQEIALSRPNLMKHFFAGLNNRNPAMPAYAEDTPTGRKVVGQKPMGKIIAGGVLGVGLLGLAGFGALKVLKLLPSDNTMAARTTPNLTTGQTSAIGQLSPTKVAVADDFGAAVSLAQEAAQAAQTAQSSAEWQSIAQKWGKASDFMAKVPAGSKNYAIAQDRTVKYRKNQAVAMKKSQL